MALTLHVQTHGGNAADAQVVARCAAAPLATTPLAELPNRAQSLTDPDTHGPALLAALVGHVRPTLDTLTKLAGDLAGYGPPLAPAPLRLAAQCLWAHPRCV